MDVSIRDICTYSFDGENKSLSIVEVVDILSDEDVKVKFHQVIVDDSGNGYFTYLCSTGKLINVSKKYLTKIDLINRQKAQIEKLEKVEHFATETIHKQAAEIEKSEKEFNDKFNSLVASNVYLINRVGKAKTEAIKEFEQRLKTHAYYIDIPKEHRVVDEDDIALVVKEMEGKEDA